MTSLCRLLLFTSAASGCVALAQPKLTIDDWLTQRVDAKVAEARARHGADDRMFVGENGRRIPRQREAPSAELRSTSLVDQGSASDFVSVALSLIPVTPAPPPGAAVGSSSAGSGVITVTAYSLLAALNKKDLTDPEFYAKHLHARGLFFSVGTAASEKETDNRDRPATVVGVKYALINRRDIYAKVNQKSLHELQTTFSEVSSIETKIKARVRQVLFCDLNRNDCPDGKPNVDKFKEFLPLLTDAGRFEKGVVNRLSSAAFDEIDRLIAEHLEAFSTLRGKIDRTYDEIRQGRQLALAVNSTTRPDDGNNDYRASLIFESGLSDRVNWIVNASADYKDRKMGLDTRGGRFATEFAGNLTGYDDSPWGRQPISLAFSGEAKWLTKQKPQYTFQAKLTVPVVAGLELPVVYRWANRRDLVDKTASEARMGLTVDLVRLARLLQPH